MQPRQPKKPPQASSSTAPKAAAGRTPLAPARTPLASASKTASKPGPVTAGKTTRTPVSSSSAKVPAAKSATPRTPIAPAAKSNVAATTTHSQPPSKAPSSKPLSLSALTAAVSPVSAFPAKASARRAVSTTSTAARTPITNNKPATVDPAPAAVPSSQPPTKALLSVCASDASGKMMETESTVEQQSTIDGALSAASRPRLTALQIAAFFHGAAQDLAYAAYSTSNVPRPAARHETASVLDEPKETPVNEAEDHATQLPQSVGGATAVSENGRMQSQRHSLAPLRQSQRNVAAFVSIVTPTASDPFADAAVELNHTRSDGVLDGVSDPDAVVPSSAPVGDVVVEQKRQQRRRSQKTGAIIRAKAAAAATSESLLSMSAHCGSAALRFSERCADKFSASVSAGEHTTVTTKTRRREERRMAVRARAIPDVAAIAQRVCRRCGVGLFRPVLATASSLPDGTGPAASAAQASSDKPDEQGETVSATATIVAADKPSGKRRSKPSELVRCPGCTVALQTLKHRLRRKQSKLSALSGSDRRRRVMAGKKITVDSNAAAAAMALPLSRKSPRDGALCARRQKSVGLRVPRMLHAVLADASVTPAAGDAKDSSSSVPKSKTTMSKKAIMKRKRKYQRSSPLIVATKAIAAVSRVQQRSGSFCVRPWRVDKASSGPEKQASSAHAAVTQPTQAVNGDGIASENAHRSSSSSFDQKATIRSLGERLDEKKKRKASTQASAVPIVTASTARPLSSVMTGASTSASTAAVAAPAFAAVAVNPVTKKAAPTATKSAPVPLHSSVKTAAKPALSTKRMQRDAEGSTSAPPAKKQQLEPTAVTAPVGGHGGLRSAAGAAVPPRAMPAIKLKPTKTSKPPQASQGNKAAGGSRQVTTAPVPSSSGRTPLASATADAATKHGALSKPSGAPSSSAAAAPSGAAKPTPRAPASTAAATPLPTVGGIFAQVGKAPPVSARGGAKKPVPKR